MPGVFQGDRLKCLRVIGFVYVVINLKCAVMWPSPASLVVPALAVDFIEVHLITSLRIITP